MKTFCNLQTVQKNVPFAIRALCLLATVTLLGATVAGCNSTNAPIDAFLPITTNNSTATAIESAAPILPATRIAYSTIHLLPAHFVNDNAARYVAPADNPVTDAGATLGRVLFYDKKLSLNNNTACATCHKQELAFTDNKRLSEGFMGGQTRRHSMSLNNIAYIDADGGGGNGRGGAATMGFFWDTRAATLEIQALAPIQDPTEMGMTLDSLTKRLAQTDYYKPLFASAFGSADVTSDRIAKALAQFMRSLITYRSKFDIGLQTNFQNFTAQENRGRAIFNGRDGNCATCHGTRQLIMERPENNGLDAVSTTDLGLAEVTGNQRDAGRFRVPSLRNIELTAPYMHDGRLLTLEDVVEHYNSRVQPHPNLSNQLRANNQANTPRRLNLSTADKQALVAFLKTLTDAEFIKDTRFSNPFAVLP
ncbi:MAG: c-type cytochrome [Ignavibacteria bacterium]|nr:c-type cytochrome [Ignavibacteria bacterium]